MGHRALVTVFAGAAVVAALAFAGCGPSEGGPCRDVTCSGHGICATDGARAWCDCDLGFVASGLECVPDGSDGDADTDVDGDADADGDTDVDADTDEDGDEDGDTCSGPDGDGDGVPDECDLCAGFDDGADGDGDGVPDGCDACPGFDDAVDRDGDGLPDGCDVCPLFPNDGDVDGDGLRNDEDLCYGGRDDEDADGDGVPDRCDLCIGADFSGDGDGDGTCDLPYAGAGWACATILPEEHGWCRWDCDTVAAEAIRPGTCYGHGLDGCCYTCYSGCTEIPAPDLDPDGDGVTAGCDVCPGVDDAALDADGDGVPDECDLCPGEDDLMDHDGDLLPDPCDVCPTVPNGADSDGDGAPDAVDLCPGSNDAADADRDLVPDGCDLCAGADSSGDGDGDGTCDLPYAGAGWACATILPEEHGWCRWDCDTVAAEAMRPGTCYGHGLDGCCYTCYSGCSPIPAPSFDHDGDGVSDACDRCPGDDYADSDGDGTIDGVSTCL